MSRRHRQPRRRCVVAVAPAADGSRLIYLVLSAPPMDTGRIRRELEWEPRYDAADAVTEILDGFRDRTGLETAPLTAAG